MRLKARLADALRSPTRFAAFVRRVGEVVWRGELVPMMHHVRPRAPTAAEYRAWAQSLPTVQRDRPLPRFIIAVDTTNRDEDAALAAALARSSHGAQAVAVRADRGWHTVGAYAAPGSMQDLARAHDAAWIWWVTEPLVLGADAALLVAAACDMTGARIVYADHDVVDDDRDEAQPHFKPAWDRMQVLERPYAGPLLVVHASLCDALDDARATGCAAQWLLLLDVLESLPDETIVHVPRVVARVRSNGDADRASDRVQVESRVRSLVESGGTLAAIEPRSTPWIRFVALPDCSVSIVIPTRDRVELLDRCLRSLVDSGVPRDTEIVIVDNGSTDPRVGELLQRVATRAQLRVVPMDVPFNFPQLCNAGVEAASGRIVVLLNNDCQVSGGWLAELVGVAAQRTVGAVGPLLLYPDGIVQSAGVLLGVNRTATSALAGFRLDDPGAVAWCRSRRRVSAVMGACLAIARDKFRRVGGMDERFAVSHNELEFCLRLDTDGLANVFTPFARVVHDEGGTRGFEVTPEERQRLLAEEQLFVHRWGQLLETTDPAHHPALARVGNPFALAPTAPPTPRAGWRAIRSR